MSIRSLELTGKSHGGPSVPPREAAQKPCLLLASYGQNRSLWMCWAQLSCSPSWIKKVVREWRAHAIFPPLKHKMCTHQFSYLLPLQFVKICSCGKNLMTAFISSFSPSMTIYWVWLHSELGAVSHTGVHPQNSLPFSVLGDYGLEDTQTLQQ
jgi:hypothetical protein